MSLVGAASSVAHLAPGGNPCGLISSSKIESALGLTHNDPNPEIRPAGSSGGVTYARCNWVVWSGALPKTQKKIVQKINNGTFATVAIETWVLAPGPQASGWQKSYGRRVLEHVSGCKTTAKNKPGHPVGLPLYGGSGSFGAIGTAFGRNVCGVWHRDNTYRIITMVLKESPHRNAVKDLKKIAKPLVSNFW